ncbi:unnamed protein product [Prunus armeniaca]
MEEILGNGSVPNNQCSNNKSETGSTEGCMSETISKERAEAAKNDAELPLFNLKRVLAATNNFNLANKLGEGGFGPVYKVTLSKLLDK